MSIDADLFRSSMRMLAGGVTIVSTELNGVKAGLTATAICSLSVEPPRLLCCINRTGSTYGAIASRRHFCVNVLSADQQHVATAFAAPAEGDKFAHGRWSVLESGAPILDEAIVSFDCRVANIVDTGSHAIVIGDILAIQKGGKLDPLLYCNGSFAGLQKQAG